MPRRWHCCGPVVVLAVLAMAPGARAQGGDIQVDPDSPSGTEYQLPLERARQDAQPGGPPKTVRPGERTAPAFGEGIQPPKASATTKPKSGDTPGSASKADPAAGATAVTAKPSAAAAGSSGNSQLVVGAIAAGVLLLGAGIGLLLRRRARPG